MPKENNANLPPWRQVRKKLFNQHPEKNEIAVVGEETPFKDVRIAMTPMAGAIIKSSEKAPSLMISSFDFR